MKYEFISHTADIKFRAFGKTLDEAFENVVLAMAEILAKGNKVKSNKKIVVDVEGNDKENLLYNLIEEILIRLDSDDFIILKAKVKVSGNKLKAEFFGDDAKRYNGLDHVKSPTYSEMYVKKIGKGWEVQVVVDV